MQKFGAELLPRISLIRIPGLSSVILLECESREVLVYLAILSVHHYIANIV